MFRFIGKLDIFSLMCAADQVWISELTLIHKNMRSVRNSHLKLYRSIWRKVHYDVIDKNYNVISEGLDRHYHKYPSWSYRTGWDINNNVCLDLQNCRYSMYIVNRVRKDMDVHEHGRQSNLTLRHKLEQRNATCIVALHVTVTVI